VQIYRFYFPMDFIVLVTQPVAQSSTDIPVILGRPFLTTSLINCRNGIMKFAFGNMTVELNNLNICKQPVIDDNEEIYEVEMIQNLVKGKFTHSMFSNPIEVCLLNPNCDDIELVIANDVLDANLVMDTNG